jgi:phosphatidylglycerol---prolipoprotein diacylglyceryl transferase
MYPILFRLGGFTVNAYGFFIAVGFIVGFVRAIRTARAKGIPFERVVDLFFYTLLFSILGSRILFVLTDVDFFLRHPSKILNLWEGGLVFYGGLLCAIAVAGIYLKRHRLPFWKWADLFSPPVALGLFFGRIGCFFAGCCYGEETSLPWAVVFTHPDSLAPLNVPLHPTQLYDATSGLAIFIILVWMEKRKSFDGQVFGCFVLLYSIPRYFIEMVRGDPRGSFMGSALSTSQGIGLGLAIASLFVLFYLKRAYRR